jgi:hypothetical protein
MKIRLLLLALLTSTLCVSGQALTDDQRKAIQSLIDTYSQAREKQDTVLLKSILTDDIDQLVSNGEWRTGIPSAVKGMVNSSSNNPGKRTLTIDRIRLTSKTTGIVDCRYEIRNTDGAVRKMWSTFVVVLDKKRWKISAIRNMLPSQ